MQVQNTKQLTVLNLSWIEVKPQRQAQIKTVKCIIMEIT